jgi:HD-GYP domain-containing protein (c-di-GMP phosphodiesterase class II)
MSRCWQHVWWQRQTLRHIAGQCRQQRESSDQPVICHPERNSGVDCGPSVSGSSKDRRIQGMVSTLWEHSAQVAALSRVIARKITKVDPETAMFAGIVHEVGNFYLLSRAEEFPSLLKSNTHHRNNGKISFRRSSG